MLSNENIIGGIVGITQNILGHPLDTLKVLVQNGTKINNTHINPRTLYAGVFYPTVHLMATNSIIFDSFKIIKERLGTQNKYNNFISASVSGIITSPITYLFECGKIKRQTEKFVSINNKPSLGNKNNKSSYIKNYLRKGFFMTTLRESVGMGFYFSAFYYLKDDLKYNAFISGCAAGVASWTTTYQIDVLKSRQMSLNISLTDAFKMGNLWKGYNYCISRAIVVNGVSLYVYDMLTNYYFV